MIDRQSRLKNGLLFNLPEALNDVTLWFIQSSDSTTIQNILDFLKLKTKPNYVFLIKKIFLSYRVFSSQTRYGKTFASLLIGPNSNKSTCHTFAKNFSTVNLMENRISSLNTSKALQQLSIQKTNFHSQYIQLLLPKCKRS